MVANENAVLEASLTFANGGHATEGKGKISGEDLLLEGKNKAFCLKLRDIWKIDPGDYKIHIALYSGENFELSQLGYKYEDFLTCLFARKNEILLHDMLMHENFLKPDIHALVEWNSAPEKSRLRFYDTALVILPNNGDPRRLPYGEITAVRREDYAQVIESEYDAPLRLSMLGKHFDFVLRQIQNAMVRLEENARALLQELIPQADSALLTKAAKLFKEGRAVAKQEMDNLSPSLWNDLEARILESPQKDEYLFLKSMAQEQSLALGVKKGLIGDLSGMYLWALFPVFSTNAADPGNAVIMEVLSGGEKKMATYIFRLMSRSAYRDCPAGKLAQEAKGFISNMNRCLNAINFRREPIYLDDAKLREPQNIQYLYSVQKLPHLRELRSRFIGRAVHSSLQNWQNTILDMLAFNVRSVDDLEKWRDQQEAVNNPTEDE